MHTVKVLYILSLASFECSKTIIPAGQKKAFLRRCLLFVRRFKSLWKRWFAWEAETEQCDEISGIHSPKERMGQLLWRVAFWARHDGVWILDSLATKIPFGNVLIILQACPETLQKRIEQKEKKGGINQLPSGSSQRTQLWSEASLFMSHMLKLIQERKLNALIIEIDTQRESIEKNVAKICEKIEATARKS